MLEIAFDGAKIEWKIAINVELSMKMVTVANVHVVLITNLCEFFGDLWHEIFGN